MNKNTSGSKEHSLYAMIAGISTVSIVVFLVLLKTYAWAESGSASVLASLVDSFMDAGISGMNLLVIRLSMKPADDEHRYGHGKVEGLAALFQSAFIVGIAVFLLLESISRFINPNQMDSYMLGVGVMATSMVMSVVIVLIQKICMRHVPSLAVEADSAHYSSDVVVNAGTMIILLALKAGAPAWIDPLFAIAVVAYLLLTVKHIGLKSINMLMDRELDPEIREKIKDIILSHPEAMGVHDLRTRQIGMRCSISFDVEMNPDKAFKDIHRYAREIEKSILSVFSNAEIMIHMDPFGEKADSRHPYHDQDPL